MLEKKIHHFLSNCTMGVQNLQPFGGLKFFLMIFLWISYPNYQFVCNNKVNIIDSKIMALIFKKLSLLYVCGVCLR